MILTGVNEELETDQQPTLSDYIEQLKGQGYRVLNDHGLIVKGPYHYVWIRFDKPKVQFMIEVSLYAGFNPAQALEVLANITTATEIAIKMNTLLDGKPELVTGGLNQVSDSL